MYEPARRNREPIFASHCFFLIYLFIFWRFQFNVNVFLSKWCTWQKKHKFSIFSRARMEFRASSFRRLLKVSL